MACTPLRAPCTAAWHSCATRSQVGGRLAGWLTIGRQCARIVLHQPAQACAVAAQKGQSWKHLLASLMSSSASGTRAAAAAAGSGHTDGVPSCPLPCSCLPVPTRFHLVAYLQAWDSARTSTCCPPSLRMWSPPATQSTACCCRCGWGRAGRAGCVCRKPGRPAAPVLACWFGCAGWLRLVQYRCGCAG